MNSNDLYQKLKDFLETEEGVREALGALDESALIMISVGGAIHAQVQVRDSKVSVENTEAKDMDFLFRATPQSIETLISGKNLNAGQLGIELIKQVLTQEITVSMPGHFLQIHRKGYLNILKAGGTDFLNELKKHGLSSLPKIISVLKNLKK